MGTIVQCFHGVRGMRLPWQRPMPAISVSYQPRDRETEWVVVDGRTVGYLYRMWRNYLACTPTRSRVFRDEYKAVRWLESQAADEPPAG